MSDIDWENGPFTKTDFARLKSTLHEYIDMEFPREEYLSLCSDILECSMKLANARLRELLDRSETMYGKKGCYGNWFMFNNRTTSDTHEAKLVRIKEIKK